LNGFRYFNIANASDMVYKWFSGLKNEYNAHVVSYAIMPNHLHVILHFHKKGFNLNSIIANGKRFIAYEINRLKQSGDVELLNYLGSLVTERQRK
jgi:REP element-mobilizing transposase RayT